MNRRKFERFAVEQGLPLERLDNDTRYMLMETEWAWRGYCEKAEETRIASSTVNHLCNRAKPFMTRRNVGRFRQVIKDTVLTDALMPDSWKSVPKDKVMVDRSEFISLLDRVLGSDVDTDLYVRAQQMFLDIQEDENDQ